MLITFGIYSIYWHYVVCRDLNNEEKEDELTNYILAIILSIVTCGIYSIYWNYKFYSKIDRVTSRNDCLICFVLCLFIPIVSVAIAQSNINCYIEMKEVE